MKKKYLFIAMALGLTTMGLQSCLDYDNPGDELGKNSKTIDKVYTRGEVDKIPYKAATDAAAANQAFTDMADHLRVGIGGQFAMRGGKQGSFPGEHQYQYQYAMGADSYAEYFVIPHSYFPYSKIRMSSSYAIDLKAYGGAWGSFSEVNKAFTPILNNDEVNKVPEMKAAYLLLYNYSAAEVADVYGPMAYREMKTNLQVGPFTYNKVEDIYDDIFMNIDTITACFKYFDSKPTDYKNAILSQFAQNFRVMQDGGVADGTLDTWRRFANSLKLRLAMHLVNVDKARAQKLAEEAVKDGVIENVNQEVRIAPVEIGFTHPLLQIQTWGDSRMSAEMEMLLKAFNHPWLRYMFDKNTNNITNNKTKAVTTAGSGVYGIRTGTHCGEGQGYDENQYIAFSKLNIDHFGDCPLYIMKYAEVCFLRAEGALRGWNMGGGSAQSFYEEGIRNGNCEDPTAPSMDGTGPNGEQNVNTFKAYLDQYLQQENVPFVYKDPTGDTEDIESPIKIGVKWNANGTQEEQLEQIISQKYLALFPNSFEAWVDLRRTGYPRTLPVLNFDEGDKSLTLGQIMQRLPFPNTSDIATKNDVDATGIPALGGPDRMATSIFWNKMPGNNF